MNTYNVNWNGLDRGHEGSWEHDQWRGVLDAFEANSPVNLNDINGTFYQTLAAKFPSVQWVTTVAGESPRTFFRDGREAWASTGVVKFPKGTSTAIITGLGRKVVSGLISYADVLAAAALLEEEHGEHPFLILLDALRMSPAGHGLSLDDTIKIMHHYRPGDDINEVLTAPKESLSGTPLRRLKAILMVMTYAGLAIQKGGLYYAGQDGSKFAKLSGDDLREAFAQWLNEENLDGSGQASSYITALDDADVIARAHCPSFSSPSVYEMPDSTLESLRDFIAAEAAKEDSSEGTGAFCALAGLHGKSYWRDGYCAAAINALIKFKATFRDKNANGGQDCVPTHPDRMDVALKLFAEKRAVDKPSGWGSYDAWTRGVRTDFVAVDDSLLVDPTFDYLGYIRKFAISWQVANTKFASHSDDEKHAVLKFLKAQKDAPKPASWYIDETNRLVVGGSQVKGMSPKAVLYFMSELHPEEFAAWTEPTYEQLAYLGLHKGAMPSDLTIETYEDCKAKQQQIVARMKELGISKASDDPSDPDYRTANEFLWWLGQDDNKDLIKEKVMSKAMKKPTTKKISTGKATISKLLGNKEDSLMTMLIAGLLTKPLAILAGVSGTGKSRMVRHLAYKTCLDEDLKPSGESAPGNFKMVQVKPSWHDSADLLGYRSAVNEKHEYVSTDFVKFVLKAHAYPKTPFFVCLDEMNLAPVEHYFAEFLSACESIRKSDVTGEWTSDPIVAATDFDNNVLNLGGDVLFESADAALDAELKKTKARIEKEGLFIPRNLFVVGTVNMDDSTGGFSRKVLDRAMTIVMNEVHFEDLQKDDKDLTISDDNLFTTTEIAKFIDRKDFDKNMMSNDFRNQLEDIRQKLEKTPFALAYRFARETCMYKNALAEILDAAEVVKNADGTAKMDGGTAINAERACGDIALDHMILMKLLPRLTGTTEQRKQVIDDINAFLGSLIKEKLVSKETLKDMVDRAGGNGGYLSFWP